MSDCFVSKSILDVRSRISLVWPVDVSDDDALAIGVCGCIKKSQNVIRFICNRNLADIVLENIETISFNNAEFVMVLRQLTSKNIDTTSLESSTWFQEKVERIQDAFKCTLLEKIAAAQWQRNSVKLACVIAMHCFENPIETLDSIFCTPLVRSDGRRIDELHFEFVNEEPNSFHFSVCLDLVARAILR